MFDSSKIADCLLFFVEIGHSIARLHYLFKKPCFAFYSSRSLTAIEIFHLINLINPNKTSGSDNINPFFLCLEAVVLAPILSIHF